ncbi:Formate/nitrite transporter, variant 2 [Balamuthia mandrillaris]
MSFLAGVFVSFGAEFAVNVAGGSPDVGSSNPGIQRLLFAIPFATGLTLIILFGAELFTGNTMFMTMGVVTRRVPLWRAGRNLLFAFFGNWAGCVFVAAFFAYYADFWKDDPWNSYVKAIAVRKVEEFDAYVYFLRSIAGNWLVCLAVFIAMAAEDIVSKMIGAIIPIVIFATSGFEHSIANMFLVTVSIMYGADVDYGKFIYKNLIPVTVGNFIGGSLCMAMAAWYLYIIEPKHQHKWTHYTHFNNSHVHNIQLAITKPTYFFRLLWAKLTRRELKKSHEDNKFIITLPVDTQNKPSTTLTSHCVANSDLSNEEQEVPKDDSDDSDVEMGTITSMNKTFPSNTSESEYNKEI